MMDDGAASSSRKQPESAAVSRSKLTPKPPPHYATPRCRDDDVDATAQHRVSEIQLARAQRMRDELLLGQMDRLADSLCHQYLQAAVATVAAAAAATTPHGGVTSRSDGAEGGAEHRGDSDNAALPLWRQSLSTPELASVETIRRHVETMQFSIQMALQRTRHPPPAASTTGAAGAVVGTTTGDGVGVGGAGLRVKMAATSVGPAVGNDGKFTPTTSQRSATFFDTQSGAAHRDLPAPPSLSTSARPVLTSVRLAPVGSANASSSDEVRLQRAFGHSQVVAQQRTAGSSNADDVFDLPAHLQRQKPPLLPRAPDGSVGGATQPEGIAPPLSLLAEPYQPCALQDDTEQDLIVPNHLATRCMKSEDHGLLIGHFQPVLDTMRRNEFRLLDCSMDGNSRCLRLRPPPKRSAVELGLLAQPVVMPAPASPRWEHEVAARVADPAPQGGYRRRLREETLLREAELIVNSGGKGQWSPRLSLYRQAADRSTHRF